MVIALVVVVLLVVGIGIVVVGADRYRPRRQSVFTVPTHEVMVDPVTSRRQRVHVDPATGERAYVDEPVPMPGSATAPLARPGLVGTPPVAYPPNATPPGGGHLQLPPAAVGAPYVFSPPPAVGPGEGAGGAAADSEAPDEGPPQP